MSSCLPLSNEKHMIRATCMCDGPQSRIVHCSNPGGDSINLNNIRSLGLRWCQTEFMLNVVLSFSNVLWAWGFQVSVLGLHWTKKVKGAEIWVSYTFMRFHSVSLHWLHVLLIHLDHRTAHTCCKDRSLLFASPILFGRLAMSDRAE